MRSGWTSTAVFTGPAPRRLDPRRQPRHLREPRRSTLAADLCQAFRPSRAHTRRQEPSPDIPVRRQRWADFQFLQPAGLPARRDPHQRDRRTHSARTHRRSRPPQATPKTPSRTRHRSVSQRAATPCNAISRKRQHLPRCGQSVQLGFGSWQPGESMRALRWRRQASRRTLTRRSARARPTWEVRERLGSSGKHRTSSTSPMRLRNAALIGRHIEI